MECGANNKYGHPSEITLDNLIKINCKIFRTDIDGEIIIKIDNIGKYKINRYIENSEIME